MTRGNTENRFVWSSDFIVVEGEWPAATALALIEATSTRWVVIRRRERMHLYALRVHEVLDSASLAAKREGGTDLRRIWLVDALNLHEQDASTVTTSSRDELPPIDLSWRPDRAHVATVHRYIERTGAGVIRAVGAKGKAVPRVLRKTRKAKAAAADLDEGTAPVRHPSIESDTPPSAGQAITLTVDARREAVEQTHGTIDLGRQLADWTTLPLDVKLQSPQIDFEADGEGRIEIRRNADSVPAIINGCVRADLERGAPVVVSAQFHAGNRLTGMALRIFTAGVAATVAADAVSGQTVGTIVAERNAVGPDLEVDIALIDKDRPWKLRWSVRTARFDGLPPQLSADICLDHDTRTEATALFKECAKLERGKHRDRIEGFGSALWGRAPQMFRDVYWALWDHYKRPLTIQFICDEPYLPWELMRPVRADESEIHLPLALKHPTARWIKSWDGYMRNQLPGGQLYTIAPKYSSIAVTLPRAEAEAQALVEQFGATKLHGTYAKVKDLFEHPPAGVGVLHFAGHGKFSAEVADSSFIMLEGTDVYTALEVGREEVKLGLACRTMVFFNACEVGAAGNVFGQVGGWAAAFLKRRFGGFIAPLWSVDDEDAGVVSAELIDHIYAKHEMIGEALRAIREKYGDRSPTFLSYLYYGDVTARIGAPAG